MTSGGTNGQPDRHHVRPPQGLAARRHTIRPMPRDLPLRNSSRGDDPPLALKLNEMEPSYLLRFRSLSGMWERRKLYWKYFIFLGNITILFHIFFLLDPIGDHAAYQFLP